ncbi:hypothetical protein MMC13_007471 [Lambiella insularis]|nr:hypothetical protein [Lambiella insularis]
MSSPGPGPVSSGSPGSVSTASSPSLSVFSRNRLSIGVLPPQSPKKITFKMQQGQESALARDPRYADQSPEYYLKLLDNFDELQLTQRVYSPNTETLLGWVKRLWTSYCTFTRQDSKKALAAISAARLHNFFHWLLNQRQGRMRSISTLETYWKVFRLVHETETGGKIDKLTTRQMQGVLQQLAKLHDLTNKKRDKPTMYEEDLFQVIKTVWVSTEMTFDHEQHRVDLSLILILAGMLGTRPGALVEGGKNRGRNRVLCYKHVQVTLIRDPEGGAPCLLVEITLEYTKGFLGDKDANTFTLPELRYDPCLVLSPQVYFLGKAFADRAFAELDSPEQLFGLAIHSRCNQQRLPWKESMLDAPICRRSMAALHGVEISPTEPLRDSTVRPWAKRAGEETGFEQVVGPYTLRRAAGKEFDSSGAISDSLRNLIMQHAESRTFQKFYLSRHITADVQAIYRRLPSQDAVMRAAGGMSRTMDSRRPRKLTEAQSASVEHHPLVCKLRRKRDRLKATIRDRGMSIASQHGTYEQYKKIRQEYRNEKQRQRATLLIEVKERYKMEQPLIDIREQLEGQWTEEETQNPATEMPVYALPERSCAIDKLFTLPASSFEDERQRQIDAINAITAICSVQESRPRRRPRPMISASGTGRQMNAQSVSVPNLSLPPSPSKLSQVGPTQCIVCLGKKQLAYKDRIRSFHSVGDLKKHFHRKHLRHYKEGEAIECHLCGIALNGPMHFQNHAARVHGTRT